MKSRAEDKLEQNSRLLAESIPAADERDERQKERDAMMQSNLDTLAVLVEKLRQALEQKASGTVAPEASSARELLLQQHPEFLVLQACSGGSQGRYERVCSSGGWAPGGPPERGQLRLQF